MTKKKAFSKENPPGWLRALGRQDLPPSISLDGRSYALVQTYKHDFFAATGLYGDAGEKVVVKIGRRASIFGFPMIFIGKFLMRRESRLLRAAAGIEGVPEVLGIVERTGVVRAYVEGAPLRKDEQLDDDFFPRLDRMLDQIHARNMAYVDLEKRENILRGADGRPHLIDFQISWQLAGWKRHLLPARWLLKVLQRSDKYHLMKHWRRLRPDQLDAATIEAELQPPFWIVWHRRIFRPITLARRQVLVWLGARSSARGRSPG